MSGTPGMRQRGRPRLSVRRREDDPASLGEALQHAQAAGKLKEACQELGIHWRKADDLIQVAEAVQKRLLTPAEVDSIGWTKAAMISRVTNRSQARTVVAVARTHTLPAFARFMRAGDFGQQGKARKLVTKCFHLTPSESQQLDDVLGLAGDEMRGSRVIDRSASLMRIIRAYRKMSSGKSNAGRNTDAAHTAR
jgi:hypothetical protein